MLARGRVRELLPQQSWPSCLCVCPCPWLSAGSGEPWPCNFRFSSASAITETIEIPQFIGRSYLTYDNPDILKR
ncbi:hypothetical protein QTO34_014070 [Cnephaeus nilssonii]|uniref:Uncharacterized protein n=1 Tax=Cnephaeus nilssonii TaxID=3371016 RepID=A0AA40LVP0_CNENI|nr:hypothetical protein QTO34_014070 [Eptesicus nilssonii]